MEKHDQRSPHKPPLDAIYRLIEMCQKHEEQEEPAFAEIRFRAENLINLTQSESDVRVIYGRYMELLGIILGRLAENLLFLITSEQGNFFKEKFDTMDELSKAFPDIAIDLSEATWCWMLGRPTACAAHLMRALEYAFKLLANHFQEPRIAEQFTWNAKLYELKKKVDVIADKEEREYFENIHSDLNTVRRRWRNNTMHLEMIYTPKEARQIYDATVTFLTDLSERLKQPASTTAPAN